MITNSYDYAKRKELFEKLGDGSCKLKNYTKAIDSYLKTLEAARLNGEGDQQLIPIFVSLYQTYIDIKDFEPALEYMRKEYEIIKDVPKEACATLLGLANVLDLAGKDFWDIDEMYRKALTEARKAGDSAVEKNVMQKLVKLCRNRHMISLAEIVENEAAEKGIDLTEATEDTEFSEDIGDILDVSLELQLSSDAESSDNEQNRPPKVSGANTRKKRPAITVKKNAKGETRLHEACINGNYQLAKVLIDQGHLVNVRDNAGWLPLHEAAIHGHRDVVELLLDNGASSAINDKGGTSCDGITPLYDAASNGNLSVVQLLLDRGAKSTLKTDFNETPLDALLRWHGDYGHKLSATEKGFYEDIKQRLVEQCEKVGIDTASKAFNTASSGYNSAKSRNSQTSQQQRHNLRFDASFSEESEGDSPTEKENSIKKSARSEYKSVMSRLKNPHKDQRFVIDPVETKRRSAHLVAQELDGDDWLEDDIGPSRKKQKFFNEKSLDASSSPVKVSTPVKSLLRKPSSNLLDPESDDEGVTVLDDAFDLVMSAGGGNRNKPKRRISSAKPPKKPSSQPSLLDAGFSRFRDLDEPTKKSPVKFSSHNSSPNESLNRSATTIPEKQLIIKVQIEDEKIIVPVNKDAANELKISWLSEEAARRYYW